MNVTAFIRKTSAKDKATIYFRVRDEKCDIKICRANWPVDPNHWDAKTSELQTAHSFGHG